MPAREKAHAAGTESVFWGKRHGFGKECFFISESMGREQRADALMRPRQGRVAGTKKGIKKCSRCRRICVAALRARFPLQFSLEVFDFLVEAGRVELPSEKGPHKASTGVVCVWIFASGQARRRASVSYPAVTPRARPGRSRRAPARCIDASATYRTSAASA